MHRCIDIHIFNPETDYALAAGRNSYNPPAKILKLRRDKAFLPALYAADGDWIMTFDDSCPETDSGKELAHLAMRRDLFITTLGKLADDMKCLNGRNFGFRPWGWNHSLLSQLERAGVDRSCLPGDDYIDSLRELSHRRTCITFQNHMQGSLPEIDIPVAHEISCSRQAEDFVKTHGEAFFKLPWSSSGRGVLHVKGELDGKTMQWIEGGIRRQGSVMAEKAFHRQLDFATEWECKGGKAIYKGLSVFVTTPDGRYSSNIEASQRELEKIVGSACPDWSERILSAQKAAILEILAPVYEGPAGIDMLADSGGRINPCVEINLRHTMGMVALEKFYQKAT